MAISWCFSCSLLVGIVIAIRTLFAFDCNQNGLPDVDDIAGGLSFDCNQNSVPDDCDIQAVNFGYRKDDAGIRIPGRFNLLKLELADLNLDGDLDLALSSEDSLNTIFQESGRFENSFSSGFQRQGLGKAVILDWSGDGYPDAVIPSFYTDRLILFRIDRRGVFGALGHILFLETGKGPVSAAAGDFNGDGLTVLFNSPGVLDPTKGGPAVFDSTVLQFGLKLPAGLTRLLNFRFQMKIPPEEAEVALYFQDIWGQFSHPFRNALTFMGRPIDSSWGGLIFKSFSFRLRSLRGGQIPGDANQDGAADLSDAIWLLRYLFLGGAGLLPCGKGASTDPANLALFDASGDGGIDLSDVIRLLTWQFLGGPPHTGGTRCSPIARCPEICKF